MKKLSYSSSIYTYQIDFAGHVSNGVYFHWLEEARQKLLEAVGMPIPKLVAEGVLPVLANIEVTYKHPLYLHNRMHMSMWIGEVRFASVVIIGEIRNEEGRLAARSTQQALFIDAQTHKPQRMSAADRDRFQDYYNSSTIAKE